MTFNLSMANCTGNPKNKSYPNKTVITNADELKSAVAFDHVCGEFENDLRSLFRKRRLTSLLVRLLTVSGGTVTNARNA